MNLGTNQDAYMTLVLVAVSVNFLHFQLRLMPFWATKTLEEVTEMESNTTGDWGDLVDGTMESECFRPCLTTRTTGALISKKNEERNHTTFDLTFEQKVIITESFYPSFSFTNLFSNLGGAMGLWLGVSVVQIFSYSVTVASALKISVFKSKN